MSNFKNEIIGAICCILLMMCFGYLVVCMLDTPTVYKSHSTGKCVSWEDKHGVHTCDTLPDTYDLVWIQ